MAAGLPILGEAPGTSGSGPTRGPSPAASAASRNSDGQLLDVDQVLVLGNGLTVSEQGRDVELDGVADVAPGLLDGLPIAEAPGQGRTVGEVPLILGLLLDHDLEVVELHGLTR